MSEHEDGVDHRALVEQGPAVVYVGSPNEPGLIYISPQAEGMLGYAPKEWFSEPELWLKILHPQDFERVMVTGERVRQTGEPFEAEYHMIAKDGREVWVRDEAVSSKDEAGRPCLWRGVMLDITERKRVEVALEECEERFRLVARATGEAIRDNDLLTGKQEWAGATEALFGYPPHESDSGAWWEERIHPDDRERVLRGVEAVLDSDGEAWSEEYRFRRADGEYAAVMDRGYVVRNAGGNPVRMVGSMADVTEKRRQEAELEESEERFRTTFEAANVGMAHAAPDGRWLRVNARFCEILGREREEFLGTTFRDLTPPEELEASVERVRRMLAGKLGPYSVERRFVKKDGSRVWVNLAVSLMRGAPGEPRYFVFVIEDFTERKLAELVPNPLTPRELEVLKLIARWQTNEDIAHSLAYSKCTIKAHVHNIITKLGVKDRRQAATKAVEIGLISHQR